MRAFAKLQPSRLPRSQPAPVALTVGFDSRFAGGGEVPGLERISLRLARSTSLETGGLPACGISELYETEGPADPCRSSLVGSGAVVSEITIPGGHPVIEEGRLRAFYGRGRGSPMILAQVRTGDPEPIVYVIPFFIWKDEESGSYSVNAYRMRRIFGKCIRTCGGPGPYSFEGIYTHISHLEMTLHRTWTDARRLHSLVNARCSAAGSAPRAVRLLLVRLGGEFGPGIGRADARCRAKP